jgi:hypothetical protein
MPSVIKRTMDNGKRSGVVARPVFSCGLYFAGRVKRIGNKKQRKIIQSVVQGFC